MKRASLLYILLTVFWSLLTSLSAFSSDESDVFVRLDELERKLEDGFNRLPEQVDKRIEGKFQAYGISVLTTQVNEIYEVLLSTKARMAGTAYPFVAERTKATESKCKELEQGLRKLQTDIGEVSAFGNSARETAQRCETLERNIETLDSAIKGLTGRVQKICDYLKYAGRICFALVLAGISGWIWMWRRSRPKGPRWREEAA